MFKLLTPVSYGITGQKVLGKLYATTREEVQTNVPIIGLPADRSLESGSWGFTHHGDLFIYDETNGFWFVGDEESSSDSLSTTLGKSLLGGIKTSVEEEEISMEEKELSVEEEKTEAPVEEPIEEIEEVKKAVKE